MANGSDSQVLGQIEGKLDMLRELVTEVRNDQKEVAGQTVALAGQINGVADHEKRIQQLERDKSYVRGWIAGAAALGGMAGATMSWILNLLTHGKS